MTKKKLSAHSCKCSGCGDDMFFSPNDGCLICPSCRGKQKIERKKDFKKHRVDEFVEGSDNNEDWAKEQKVLKCPNCGAGAIVQSYQMSASCPYCSSELVASSASLVGLQPDAVVPFKFDKERAGELFRNKIIKNAFVPNKFKREINTDNLQAFYFPAFIYDAECRSAYRGRLYETYTVRRHDRTEVRRRYFNISGTKDTKHHGVEVEASSKLEQHELDWVRPYNLNEAVNYTYGYVAGYQLETYSTGVKQTNSQARGIIDKKIQREILNSYRYDGISYFKVDTQYFNEQFSYCVLPMYRINYKYKNKNYSNVMNGQSGALGGKIPKSGIKIALTVLAPILFVLAIILAAMFI